MANDSAESSHDSSRCLYMCCWYVRLDKADRGCLCEWRGERTIQLLRKAAVNER